MAAVENMEQFMFETLEAFKRNTRMARKVAAALKADGAPAALVEEWEAFERRSMERTAELVSLQEKRRADRRADEAEAGGVFDDIIGGLAVPAAAPPIDTYPAFLAGFIGDVMPTAPAGADGSQIRLWRQSWEDGRRAGDNDEGGF